MEPMDRHVKEFYQQFSDETPEGRFHCVISLHEGPDLSWKELHKKFPVLSKGWYELTLLDTQDRIDFTREYWLSKLPYHPRLNDSLIRFFDSLDDIGIFIFQEKFDDPFDVNIVYSLKDNSGFFRGALPADEKTIIDIESQFPDVILPSDYIAFMKIHSGFCKTTDCTGLIKINHLFKAYQQFQNLVAEQEYVTTTSGKCVDPKTLIPFYESFGLPFYQCFWTEWYPEQEMGNVYFSGNTMTVNDVAEADIGSSSMAFPSFTDWLIFYLERIV